MEASEEPGTNFEIQVPPEQEAGTYANFLTVWHTGHEFTLDFSVTQPPQTDDPDDPASPVTVPSRVVARVRIPPTLLFDVLRALNENMSRYEATYGEIRQPGSEEDEES